MNRAVWLVSRRELTTRMRSKAFVVGTVAFAVLLGLSGVLGFSALGDRTSVGVAGQAVAVAKPLRQTMAAHGNPVELVDVAEPNHGRQQVRDGELDALITGAPDALTLEVADGADRRLRAALDSLDGIAARVSELRARGYRVALDTEIAKQGLNPVEVRESTQGAHVQVHHLRPDDPRAGPRLAIAMAAGVLMYMFLLLGGQMVAHSVVEEKASRVVEMLLSTIRPAELLTGKVLGTGLTVLLQFSALGVAGLGAATLSGAMTLPASALVRA